MKQALHIFRKDVRFLWLPIAISLSLAAVFTWSWSVEKPSPARIQLTVLLILGWFYLAGSAIFKERPVGDRQFWTTRPYRWGSLVAAKAIFLVAFLHLPLLAIDLTILAAQGFAPSVATLFWRQAGLAALITIPAAALASVTRNVAELAISALGLFVAIMTSSVMFDAAKRTWPRAEWLHGAILLAILFTAGAVTLVWQYASRRATAGRAIGGSGVAVCLLVMLLPPLGGWLAAWTPPEPAMLRSLDLAPEDSYPRRQDLDAGVELVVRGAPARVSPDPEMIAVTIEDAHGPVWHSAWLPAFRTNESDLVHWNPDDVGTRIFINFEPALARRFHGVAVKLRIGAILAIYGATATTSVLPVDGRPHPSAGVGRCAAGQGSQVLLLKCWSSVFPRGRVRLDDTTVAGPPSFYLDYLSATPVLESATAIAGDRPKGPTVTLTTAPAIARIRRDIEILLTPSGESR
jgi:hypothetical protein